VTIKFVGTANVNEQVVRANMQIREGGDFDEVILDRDIRSLYRTGLFEFIEVKHEPVDAQTFNLVVEVTPKFRVLNVRFEGNKKIKTSRLEKEATRPWMNGRSRKTRKSCASITRKPDTTRSPSITRSTVIALAASER
jgi:outer membrane protein insertion porin family